jgi:hypothetical protein
MDYIYTNLGQDASDASFNRMRQAGKFYFKDQYFFVNDKTACLTMKIVEFTGDCHYKNECLLIEVKKHWSWLVLG